MSVKKSRFLIGLIVFLGISGVHAEKAQTLFKPVELMHPGEGWDVTDIAVSFRWKVQNDQTKKWRTVKYQLQVGNDDKFEKPRLDCVVEAPNDPSQPNYHYWKQMSWQPEDLLPQGTWHWRMRIADDPVGPWSPPIKFTVNDIHSVAARPVHEISVVRPLAVFDMYNLEKCDTAWDAYWGCIPDDLKPHVAFQINRFGVGRDGNDVSFIDMVAKATGSGALVFVGSGGPNKPVGHYCDLTELERIFQQSPKAIGVTIAETCWGYGARGKQEMLYYQRLLPLCAKYGRHLIQGDGNWGRYNWDRIFSGCARYSLDTLKRCAPYYVPCAKTNIRCAGFEASSAVMGGWLAGLVENSGTWCEAWYWEDVGFSELFAPVSAHGDLRKMPPLFWNQKFITGVAAGTAVLKFGGESSVTEHGKYDASMDCFDRKMIGSTYTAVWDSVGHKTPVLDRYVVPFLRALVQQSMIPSKAEVLKATRVAVMADPAKPGDPTDYGAYAPLYLGTYGISDYVGLDRTANSPVANVKPSLNSARYVRVQKTSYGILNIAEVKVFSGEENIAKTGVPSQSSTSMGGDAKRATDGIANGCWSAGSVTHTKAEDKPWWELDLGSQRQIDRIEVFIRNDNGNYASVSLDGALSLLDESRKEIWKTRLGASERSNNGALYEVLPNNGRYYMIPVFPNEVAVPDGITKVKLSELKDINSVKTIFDPKYPDQKSGDAWVCQVGGRIFVMNNHENKNVAQNYSIELGGTGLLRRISGTAIPHWYMMGRQTADGFWFQANANHKGAYTDGRQTRLVLTCSRQISVSVNPQHALLKQSWDKDKQELELTLSHDSGAVDVSVK